VVGLMTIGGVQLIMIGIVGEYIGKILSELKARPIYFVAEHSEKRVAQETDAGTSERTAAE
jgi:polyisoprenyl-phosphate glycosyltransferase